MKTRRPGHQVSVPVTYRIMNHGMPTVNLIDRNRDHPVFLYFSTLITLTAAYMKQTPYFSILLTILFLFTFKAPRSQDTLMSGYAETITGQELSDYVRALASEQFEGRSTGTEGQRRAAEYLRQEFRNTGMINPFTDTSQPYYQAYSLEKCYWKENYLAVGGSPLVSGEDYIFLSGPIDRDTTLPVIYAGFGIDNPVYSDLKELDVKGRVVVAFSGEPKDKKGNYFISGGKEPSRQAYYFSKSRKAREKGAAGLVVVARSEKDYGEITEAYEDYLDRPDVSYPGEHEESVFFTVYMSPEKAAGLLNTSPSTLKRSLKQIQAKHRTDAGIYDGELKLTASKECYEMGTENVVGFIEGTSRKNEAIVVVAHFDHLGIREGNYYPGADDNASGTAAVMEIAEAFAAAAKDGHRPARSVVFLAVTGEEIGLHGSHYYSENPVVPLENTYACINIDMIGRVGNRYDEDTSYVAGWSYLSLELLEVARKNTELVSPDLKFKMLYRPNASGGSDHYYFARSGIPSLFYFTGIHDDYHSPDDTPDKLLYDRMEKITRSIFATAWDLANREGGWLLQEGGE